MTSTANTNSAFQTMGVMNATPVNLSAAPSSNTTFAPRHNTQAGQDPSVGTKKNRKGTLERNGFKGAPQMTRAYPQPDAREGRNVRLFPSAVGNRDFYAARARSSASAGGPAGDGRNIPDGAWSVLKTLG